MEQEKVHGLVNCQAIVCWEIFLAHPEDEYEAERMILCASKELAEEVIRLIRDSAAEMEGKEFLVDWRGESWENVRQLDPEDVEYCEKVVREDEDVCQTVTEALVALGGQPFVEDFHNDMPACITAGQHLRSVDEDGYCNGCGHQDEEDPDACEECGAPPGKCDPRCPRCEQE